MLRPGVHTMNGHTSRARGHQGRAMDADQGGPRWCPRASRGSVDTVSEMSVDATLRDFWRTRPRRRSEDRMLAGVAAAIGRRYGIDPVLVRIAFVVTTFYGSVGVLLYLLGWLLLPVDNDQVSAAEAILGRGRSSVSTALTICLGLALIPASGAVLGLQPTGLVALALCAGALFLLHRHRSGAGELPTAESGTTETTSDAATAGAAPAGPAAPASPAAPDTAERSTPPAWDPLGTAPFAWDLPDPSPAAPPAPAEPRPPRSKVTPVTLGLALLAGGIASAFIPAIGPAQVAGVVLAVIGFGLVAGSMLHSGRGLIAVAVPLALLIWVLQAAPAAGVSAGERRWDAGTVAAVQPRYDLTAGSGWLDLSDLRMRNGQTVATAVSVSLGEAKVFLPPDVDVALTCGAAIGDVNCLDRTSSGIPSQVAVRDTGRDGPGGGTLLLDVRTGTGNVEVTRG
ncbi:MAG: PspC domain-containing protein [Pseudonocardiaceae bacterium]|nr:PspC domain-containing protein [Pseudonocardiaceae bacterium]